ncbi:GTP-binding protein [Acinetobacter sp. ANC 4178]|uniref:GTP-binding protein n=1 Tax=Acinetobacter sp. ANC 4178 TaxID=2529839 RepID=UPI00103BEFC3|nr:ATP/GTP-binding protein [Acinetobacter sp. ANC 4178]TCB67196.1 GTP-binding protein [Acinetobacter sp. ANC 4178]
MILQRFKIVFAGGMGAGKTEAIKSLSDIPVLHTEAFNTDSQRHTKMETTVGIDYGEITLDENVTIGLYGTPGQSRFDFIWSAISKGAIGAVILIDHHSDNPIQELESYLETFQNFTDNIAIGITHTDLISENSKSTGIYKDWLLQNDLFSPLYFIDARKKDDVLLLLEALITSIEINSNIAN